MHQCIAAPDAPLVLAALCLKHHFAVDGQGHATCISNRLIELGCPFQYQWLQSRGWIYAAWLRLNFCKSPSEAYFLSLANVLPNEKSMRDRLMFIWFYKYRFMV
ncbi:hypothetical protein [Comamonas sp. CMM02]|uniref:hypothetical protein n=1 Tax=Comamonas sp. CMM02 TaxID=2769307 RepID=UPI00177C9BEB|nr:hypothetical protein [Comamonas sp. CMM02]